MTQQQPLPTTAAAAKALGHAARLRIFAMLSSGPLCVCQLTAVLRTAPSTVSEHLRELRRAGLVAEEKSGKFVFYRPAASRHALRWMRVVRAGVVGDPAAVADARLVARLRGVPVEEFAASGGRLPAVAGRRRAT